MRSCLIPSIQCGLIGLAMLGLTGCQSLSVTAPASPSVTGYAALEASGPIIEVSPLPTVGAEPLQLAMPFSAPVSPENFYAGHGYSDQFGVYYNGQSTMFQAQMPPGDYVLTYRTTLGEFYIVFTATANALLNIGLNNDDLVYEAILYRGTVTDPSYTYEDDPVIVYSKLGARTGWWHIFRRDNSPGIMLIGWIGVTYEAGEALTLTLPRPARYVLNYRTNFGSYRVEFQTTKFQEQYRVQLQPDEVVLEAYVTIYDD